MAKLVLARRMALAFGCATLLTSLLGAPLQAQPKNTDTEIQTELQTEHNSESSTSIAVISLSWADLEAGCEAPDLETIGAQQCQLQLAHWRADYQAPLQQPDLLLPALDAVLAELPVIPSAEQSLWSRAWGWLREQLGGGSTAVPNWLRNWQAPEALIDWIIGLTVGACVLLALGIVGNELLQVYRSRAVTHVPGSSAVVSGPSVAPELQTLSDLASYPLQEQPRLLLQIVINHLQQRSLLSWQASRTHQDLLQHAPQLGELGKPLADIAQAAERTTYGNWQVSNAEVEPLVTAAEWLVAHAEVEAGHQANIHER